MFQCQPESLTVSSVKRKQTKLSMELIRHIQWWNWWSNYDPVLNKYYCKSIRGRLRATTPLHLHQSQSLQESMGAWPGDILNIILINLSSHLCTGIPLVEPLVEPPRAKWIWKTPKQHDWATWTMSCMWTASCIQVQFVARFGWKEMVGLSVAN